VILIDEAESVETLDAMLAHDAMRLRIAKERNDHAVERGIWTRIDQLLDSRLVLLNREGLVSSKR
jgi:hypothetical protein